MSYQVLARKWRPKCFEELVGQEHVVTVLVNAINEQRLHHAYLFTGTRGVGKTTIARIFAKSLNCETGVTATPCGKCDTCLEIDQGRFIDLIEIDAASKTKVDDTRELLDNVQYAPTRGRYKVYLIDEVHMLSRHSFNALLKTLEEPPEHVKFILATTDPQKLPVTVLSRCLQFHLKALTVKQIESKLIEILANEKVTHDSGTLTLLAKAACGSMRDSLSLTDQAIAQGKGYITLPNLQQMLGGIDQNWVYKIVIALLKQDGKNLMLLTQEIASFAPSYSRLFAELIQLFHQMAIFQIIEQHFDLSSEHAQLLKKFSQSITPEDVQLYYQICVNGRKDLPYTSDEQAAFDMTLIRLFAFKPMQKEQLNTDELISLTPTDVTDIDSSFMDKTVENEQTLAQEMQNIEAQAAEIKNIETKEKINQTTDSVDEFNNPDTVEEEQLETPIETIISKNSEEIIPEQNNKEETTPFISPVSSVLASRNMLRSRKKELEKQEKKLDGAVSRPTDLSKLEKEVEVPLKKENGIVELPIPEQSFQVENIDPATIRKANQVDEWANMIDSMELIARLRQLAIHATIDENSTEDNLILCLDQATKHLHTDLAQQQLEQSISDYLARNIKVTINIVDKTIADPYQIQSHINDKRSDYAKELLKNDEIVQDLEKRFQATLDDGSIEAI